MYSSDYDDMVILTQLPNDPWTSWPILIQPYVKNTDIVWDPSRQRTVTVGAQPWTNSPNINWGWETHMAINRFAYANAENILSNIVNRNQTGFPFPSERIAWTYGEDQTGDNFNSQSWFDGTRCSCPSLASTPTNQSQDWYNQCARAAVKYHGDGIISAYADGHAKKVNYKRITVNQASFGDSGNCEGTNYFGPDGQRGTGDDLDTELTRAWGRWYDSAY